MPFGPSKEAKLAPLHIICGDFNAYPGDEKYGMHTHGFISKIPKNAATTSGRQNYDNVLVNTHANDEFLIGGGILQLKNPHNAARSEVGLSDHFPVFLEIVEVQKTKRAAALVVGAPLRVVDAIEKSPAEETQLQTAEAFEAPEETAEAPQPPEYTTEAPEEPEAPVEIVKEAPEEPPQETVEEPEEEAAKEEDVVAELVREAVQRVACSGGGRHVHRRGRRRTC